MNKLILIATMIMTCGVTFGQFIDDPVIATSQLYINGIDQKSGLTVKCTYWNTLHWEGIENTQLIQIVCVDGNRWVLYLGMGNSGYVEEGMKYQIMFSDMSIISLPCIQTGSLGYGKAMYRINDSDLQKLRTKPIVQVIAMYAQDNGCTYSAVSNLLIDESDLIMRLLRLF
ncbi:MAG: hypothetical protein FWF42_03425 [Streptococcaceae bacterium]|nr:hypothetical protein [Streptococcaceae bacterium]